MKRTNHVLYCHVTLSLPLAGHRRREAAEAAISELSMPPGRSRCHSRLYACSTVTLPGSRLLRAVAVGEGGWCEPEGRWQYALARMLASDGAVVSEVDLVSKKTDEA